MEISVRGAELYQYFYSYVLYRWNKADVLHASYDMRFLRMLLYIKMAGELPWRETGFFSEGIYQRRICSPLCWQVHYFYTGDFSGQEKGTPEQMLWRVLHMVVIYAVLYILIYLIERYLKKDIEELQITRRELLVVYFVLIMVYCISNVSYVDVKAHFQCGNSYGCVYYPYTGGSHGMAVLYAYHIRKRDP